MKKLRLIVVLLFAVVMVSGCSCTSSMCSDEDLTNIRTAIEEKWNNNENYKTLLREEAITKGTNESLIEQYVQDSIEKKIEEEYEKHPKACLTNTEMEDPDTGAKISSKSWKEAFNEGLLEGLIVYPISLLLISFTNMFGNNGGGQVLAIILTTIIIRIFMLIFTFKSQIQSQKLQNLQIEISEISNKLKDPNLSQAEKSRLSMKVMEIYQKNGINPLSSLIQPFISLPIFLSVWSAVSQTLVIRTGEFLGLSLGSSVSEQIFSFSISAIILFILMAGSQILSMKMPNIIRLRKANYKNREQIKESNKQMATMTNIMLIMILLSGAVLPSALAIYWTIGALISIAQTIIFSSDKVKNKLSNIGNRKKKAKVVQ